MPDDIKIVLIVIGYCIIIISPMVQDWIYAKIRLRGYNPIVAEVIYFDKVSWFRSSSTVTIVSYKNNDLQKDAVILKAKKDKIGDKIEIITDGEIAVRKKIALKEDQNIGLSLVMMFIFLKWLGPDDALYLVVIIGLILTVFNPVLHDVFDSEIKEKLGWRR